LASFKDNGTPRGRKVRDACSRVAPGGRDARRMDGRGEPRHQPIGMHPTVALIDGLTR
jgi:hypothetical protein